MSVYNFLNQWCNSPRLFAQSWFREFQELDNDKIGRWFDRALDVVARDERLAAGFLKLNAEGKEKVLRVLGAAFKSQLLEYEGDL